MSRVRRGPMKAGFEPYQDKAGKWRWRLFAANGLVVATGNECFSSRAGCMQSIRTVLALAAEVLVS